MEKGKEIKRIVLQTVNVLLTTGPSIPNVNLTNGDKETALHCAAQVNIFCLAFEGQVAPGSYHGKN